jgi:hypothetical protein
MKRTVFLIIILLQIQALHAQEFVIAKPEKISAIKTQDMFGWQVSQNKDFIFATAPFEDDIQKNVGGIYVYKKDAMGYRFLQRLVLAPGAVNAKFGSVMAHSDQYLVATTHYAVKTEKGIGTIHVYKIDGGKWQLTQSFEIETGGGAPPPSSMAISGNTIVLGIPARTKLFPNGFVGIYNIDPATNAVVAKQRINPEGLNSYDKIGYQVAIENDMLAFSVLSANGINKNSGAVWLYSYRNNTWQMLTKLSSSEANEHDKFGSSINIKYPNIAIGAMRQSDNTSQKKCGAVYVYRMTGQKPSLEAILGPDIAANHYDYFGCSVSLAEDVLAVGANSDDNAGINTGAVYVFKRIGSDWQQVNKLIGSGVNNDALFGSSISVYGNDVVCSSHLEETDTTKQDHGSVYLFKNAASPEIFKNLGENYVTLYPNPIIDNVTIYINDESVRKIIVFDISGRILAEVKGGALETQNNSLVYTFDTRRWGNGNLIFRVVSKKGITNIKAAKSGQ